MTKSLREERAEFDAVNREHATPIVQLSQDEYRALRDALAAAEAALAACERERDLFKMHRDTDYAAYQEHLENAAKDSARLDWLATNSADLKHLDPLFDSRHGRYELWVVDAPTFDVCADTPREAIDKAIARAPRP